MGQVREIRGLGDQLNAVCLQVVESGGSSVVGTCVVVVEQQATGADRVFLCLPAIQQRKTQSVIASLLVFCSSVQIEHGRFPVCILTAHVAMHSGIYILFPYMDITVCRRLDGVHSKPRRPWAGRR